MNVLKRSLLVISGLLLFTACGQSGGASSAGLESATGGVITPVGGSASPTGDPNCVDTSTDAPALREAREEVCAIANEERARVGAKPLVLEVERSKVAQVHATDMANRDYFSHTSPEGKTPSDRLGTAGISWRTWGENIAMNPGTPESVMSQWMNSSGHKANILNANFGKLGVGYDDGRWVQVFTN